MYDYLVYFAIVILKYQVVVETLLMLVLCGMVSWIIWIFRTHSFLTYDEISRKIYLDLGYLKAKASRVLYLAKLNVAELYLAHLEWGND